MFDNAVSYAIVEIVGAALSIMWFAMFAVSPVTTMCYHSADIVIASVVGLIGWVGATYYSELYDEES